MLSYHWNDMSASSQLKDLPTRASDHVPLLLYIKPHINPPKRLFRFETSWLKYEEISEVVARAWLPTNNNDPIKKFRQKVVCVQRELKAWAQAKFQKWDTYLERSKWVVQQLNRAEEARNLNMGEFRLRIKLREQIFEMMEVNEEKWKQRSGNTGLKLDDKNTNFFHATANGRKNSNSIAALNTDQGELILPHRISDYLLRHFKNLLESGRNQPRPFDLTGSVGTSLQEELRHLDDEITEEEVLRAINDMPTGKASEPDGLPQKFYKAFWQIITGDAEKQDPHSGSHGISWLHGSTGMSTLRFKQTRNSEPHIVELCICYQVLDSIAS